jgi:hypothetical protein
MITKVILVDITLVAIISGGIGITALTHNVIFVKKDVEDQIVVHPDFIEKCTECMLIHHTSMAEGTECTSIHITSMAECTECKSIHHTSMEECTECTSIYHTSMAEGTECMLIHITFMEEGIGIHNILTEECVTNLIHTIKL